MLSLLRNSPAGFNWEKIFRSRSGEGKEGKEERERGWVGIRACTVVPANREHRVQGRFKEKQPKEGQKPKQGIYLLGAEMRRGRSGGFDPSHHNIHLVPQG